MKLIFQYYERFYPMSGGIETCINSIIENIPKYKFEVLTNAIPDYPLREQHWENALIHRFLPYNHNFTPYNKIVSKLSFPYRIGCDWVRFHRKCAYLKKTKFDILHVHGACPEGNFLRLNLLLKPLTFTKLMDFSFVSQPKILTLHGLLSALTDDPKVKKVMKKYEVFAIDQFDNIICVDKNIYSYVQEHIEESSQDKNIWYIPNSVDTTKFSFVPPSNEEKLKVGFIGRLESSRGIELLVKLTKNLPDCIELYVVGSGNQIAIEKFKSSVDISKIHFYTNIKNEDIPEFIHRVNVLFNPVLAEGISRISLESMSCGRPPIMLDMGDRYPVVNRKTGYLIQNDLNELLRLLEYLYENREELRKVGGNARKLVVSEFDNEVIIPRIKTIYDKLIK